MSTAVLRKAWRLSMWKILSLFVFCFVLLKRGWACFDMLSGIGNSSGDLPQSEITQEFSHLQRAPKTKIIFEWWFSYWNIFAAFEDSDDHEFCLEFSLKLWPQLRPLMKYLSYQQWEKDFKNSEIPDSFRVKIFI